MSVFILGVSMLASVRLDFIIQNLTTGQQFCLKLAHVLVFLPEWQR